MDCRAWGAGVGRTNPVRPGWIRIRKTVQKLLRECHSSTGLVKSALNGTGLVRTTRRPGGRRSGRPNRGRNHPTGVPGVGMVLGAEAFADSWRKEDRRGVRLVAARALLPHRRARVRRRWGRYTGPGLCDPSAGKAARRRGVSRTGAAVSEVRSWGFQEPAIPAGGADECVGRAPGCAVRVLWGSVQGGLRGGAAASVCSVRSGLGVPGGRARRDAGR